MAGRWAIFPVVAPIAHHGAPLRSRKGPVLSELGRLKPSLPQATLHDATIEATEAAENGAPRWLR